MILVSLPVFLLVIIIIMLLWTYYQKKIQSMKIGDVPTLPFQDDFERKERNRKRRKYRLSNRMVKYRGVRRRKKYTKQDMKQIVKNRVDN